jgi:6-pyruvoyltetrahydropterin/6-carboxytetrahydropterin synthase
VQARARVGRIVDFSVIKERVGGWLGERWDHAFIAQIGDPIAEVLRAEGLRLDVLPCPPTAEHLARVLFEEACALLRGTGVRLEHVRCYETPTCWADYAP